MADGEGNDNLPLTPIGIPPIRLRRPILRWTFAVFSSLCGLISILFEGGLNYLLDNKIRAFGWQDVVSRFGSARLVIVSLVLGPIAASRVMFFVAARSFLAGRFTRALLWYRAAFVAGVLGSFLLP